MDDGKGLIDPKIALIVASAIVSGVVSSYFAGADRQLEMEKKLVEIAAKHTAMREGVNSLASVNTELVKSIIKLETKLENLESEVTRLRNQEKGN
jgi:TolA-binding protein